MRTKGQAAALAAVRGMLVGRMPHAVLLAGPAGVGKTTLALDLAAGLLCMPADEAARPCRACRACRMVEHGNHPDLHWLRPEGPGGQVVIGGPDARFRGVRDLVAELALLPVEGGARVAIIERADRMNEDAQSALLKTLEEPPAGVTIVLCADDEERLLPTVRSRCARVRLGPVGQRAVEEILVEQDAADPPTAARLGRLAGGRPGVAFAYARVPEAARIRGEIARSLIDLVDARPAVRLEALRTLVPRATELVVALESPPPPASVATSPGRSRRGRGGAAGGSPSAGGLPPSPPADEPPPTDAADSAVDPALDDGARRIPAAERRRGASLLISIWTDVARDIALTAAGEPASIRDPSLLDDLGPVAAGLAPGAMAAFLERLARAGELLEVNVAPELILDSLVLAWPNRTRAA